ncbi:cellulase family glycosylhydrolase [Actinoplanes sp. ATCC 53533]|uniref:cellulase family glycosylhydrolase n=1 Tax=Actinoplanes sp. ATCC 53533 TaxID=1288362 RepID=UPI001315835B|nr:cellulase family glycosylhydrolase [Actinoplanes sp. ATCC 53533]
MTHERNRGSARPSRGGFRRTYRGIIVLLSTVVAVTGLAGPSPATAGTAKSAAIAADAPNHGFLTRSGRQLMLDGQPYKFVGVNAFGLTGCDGALTDTSEAGLDAYFASLRPKSITRTWAFKPFGLEVVDRVVAAAERHNQMVIFALADGANYCADDGHDAAFYAGGFRGDYLTWVRSVVPRYRDSKAVAMWELMNEPKGASSDTVMKTFFDETAAIIKSLDPNHLVSSGSQAAYVDGTNDYAYVHSGPDIDAGSLHEYDYDYQNSHTIVSGWFEPAIEGMNALDKPLYVGEVGVAAADTIAGCRSRAARADVFRQKFDAYLNGGATGVLAWSYRTTKTENCADSDATIYPADSYMAMAKSYDLPGVTDPTDGPPGVGRYDEESYTFSGTWAASADPAKFNGDDRFTQTAGSYYTFSFTGTKVQLYAAVASHHGIAAVSIDGGAEVDVDFYAATRAEQHLSYTSPTLTAGTHLIKVRNTGRKNTASTGTVIAADRIDVTS